MNLKRTVFYSAICIVIFSVVMAATYELSTPAASDILSTNADKISVVLDAGHGGEDGGAVSKSGVVESQLNLKITRKLKAIMDINGFKTVMTRKDEGDLSDKSLKTIAERKKSDMYRRLEIYNSNISNIAISIHQNMFPAISCKGSQVFYSTRIPTAQKLAENISANIKDDLHQENIREPKPTSGNIFLLDNAAVPAVIVECGFLSNEDEVKTLCDVDYQKKISFSIFKGFIYTREFM